MALQEWRGICKKLDICPTKYLDTLHRAGFCLRDVREIKRFPAGGAVVDDPVGKIECRRAHQLLSQQMDAPLSPVDRARLELHLAVCGLCTLVARQFQSLRSAVRRL